MDGIFWQSCKAAKLGESCSPEAAEGEPSGKFIPSSSKAVCCLSFKPVSLGVGPDKRPMPWEGPDSSSSESELISMIGSCSWEPCRGLKGSGVGGGEYLISSAGSKYSMDMSSSFTSSASDSRSTLGKFQKRLRLESYLFHPYDRYGKRSPEAVDDFQHLRASPQNFLSFLQFRPDIRPDGNFLDKFSQR